MTTDLADLYKKIDRSLVHPRLVELCSRMLIACEARGARYYAISGFRSVNEQDALFAQGRPGGPPGKIVTKARGGQSAHNFGAAIDFCRDADMTRAGLQMDWETEDYRILSEEAAKVGAESGFGWQFQDAPHVQLPLKSKSIELYDVKAAKCLLNAYKSGGNAAVRLMLDRETW